MNRNSDVSDQECFSYGISRPEVQFVPNPSSRSDHRLLTPSQIYDNDSETQESHHYEDPARLAQIMLTNNALGPRRKANDLYEPMAMPLKTINSVKHRVRTLSRSSEDSITGFTYHGREPICHRIILYLVLLLSLTATVLVVLLIFGFVGPACRCGDKSLKPEASSSQQAFSVEPLQQTIESLRLNMSRMEALLNQEKRSNDDIQVPIVNGTLSVADLQKYVNDKINSSSNKLKAMDDGILTQIVEVNSTLTRKIQSIKIQSIKVLEGPSGAPGKNGSHGEGGVQGPQGIQGLPGVQGLHGVNGSRGPPGPGNFSMCTYHIKKSATHLQNEATSTSVDLVQPNGFIIIGSSCSTIGASEYNLQINVPKNGGNPFFQCHCKGISTFFSPEKDPDQPLDTTKKVMCFLHYWMCPKTT